MADPRRHAEALSHYWDALTAGDSPDPGALDPDEAAFVSFLVSQARRAQTPAGARERARRELLRQFAQYQAQQRNGGSSMTTSGILSPLAPFAPRGRTVTLDRSRRRAGRLYTTFSYLGAFALVLAMLAGIFFAYRDGGSPAVIPAVQASPVATPQPSGWLQFRGNAAHTGLAAGPGPEGAPVLLWKAHPTGDTGVDSISDPPAIADGVMYIGTGHG
jgi:hypothetical protein